MIDEPKSPTIDMVPEFQNRYWLNKRTERLKNYAQADYLLWWAGDSELPDSLVTTDPAGTAIDDVGTSPGNRTVLGGDAVGDWPHSGLRLRLGRFISDSRVSRVELDLWHLFEDTDSFNVGSSDGSVILSRPFSNTTDPANPFLDAQVISFPGLASGSFDAQYSRTASGVDPTIFFCLGSSTCRWLEFATGYRFLYLQDQLNLNERVLLEPGGLIAPGTGYEVRDDFTARNLYHLWQFGLSHTENHGNWLFNIRGNVGMGVVRREVDIHGTTNYFVGSTATSQQSGGLLALRTNSGTHSETDFAILPELNVNLKRRLGEHLSAHVGYSILFLPDAVQAVDHVPTAIDPRNIPLEQPGGGPDPQFKFVTEDLVLHGLNFGLRYDY